jgi:3-hydroxyisobutyrate dehydrogenase-like beta-hydroxyacid dehydrogenase
VIVGLVNPGEMGAAVGNRLVDAGHEVVWASQGRSEATVERARPFRDVGSLGAVAAAAEVILSICPPHAATDVATDLDGFGGIYVDANAVSPMRAREMAAFHPRFVDGGIVGGPPTEPGTTLYLSGGDADVVAALFDGTELATRIVGDASAVKMAYAAWSKGTAALLLSIRDVARAFDVEDEWRLATPELQERLAAAERSASTKSRRWVGEMEEIAETFAAAGAPDGFHRAAAEVFAR